MKLPSPKLRRERFSIPYLFRPQLTLTESLTAAIFAFLRIILGSLLFALCGTGIWATWAAVDNLFLRVVAVLPLVVIFLFLFAWLMIAISALARRFFPS